MGTLQIIAIYWLLHDPHNIKKYGESYGSTFQVELFNRFSYRSIQRMPGHVEQNCEFLGS